MVFWKWRLANSQIVIWQFQETHSVPNDLPGGLFFNGDSSISRNVIYSIFSSFSRNCPSFGQISDANFGQFAQNCQKNWAFPIGLHLRNSNRRPILSGDSGNFGNYAHFGIPLSIGECPKLDFQVLYTSSASAVVFANRESMALKKPFLHFFRKKWDFLRQISFVNGAFYPLGLPYFRKK